MDPVLGGEDEVANLRTLRRLYLEAIKRRAGERERTLEAVNPPADKPHFDVNRHEPSHRSGVPSGLDSTSKLLQVEAARSTATQATPPPIEVSREDSTSLVDLLSSNDDDVDGLTVEELTKLLRVCGTGAGTLCSWH